MIAAKLDMLTHLIAQHSKCAHYKIRDKQRLHQIFNECDALSEAAYGAVARSPATPGKHRSNLSGTTGDKTVVYAAFSGSSGARTGYG